MPRTILSSVLEATKFLAEDNNYSLCLRYSLGVFCIPEQQFWASLLHYLCIFRSYTAIISPVALFLHIL